MLISTIPLLVTLTVSGALVIIVPDELEGYESENIYHRLQLKPSGTNNDDRQNEDDIKLYFNTYLGQGERSKRNHNPEYDERDQEKRHQLNHENNNDDSDRSRPVNKKENIGDENAEEHVDDYNEDPNDNNQLKKRKDSEELNDDSEFNDDSDEKSYYNTDTYEKIKNSIKWPEEESEWFKEFDNDDDEFEKLYRGYGKFGRYGRYDRFGEYRGYTKFGCLDLGHGNIVEI